MNPEEQQIVVEIKRWWKSFTVWFNSAVVFLMGLDWAAAQLQLPNLQQYVPSWAYHLAVVIVGLMNIWIRVKRTKGPIQ